MSWLIEKITRNKQGRALTRLLFLFCVLFSFLSLPSANSRVLVSGPKKAVSEKSRGLVYKPIKDAIKIHPAKAGKKQKYKVEFNKDTDKTNVGEVEVGDFASKEFKPQAKIKRWGGEAYLNVGVPDTNIPASEQSINLKGDRVEWDSPEIGASFYKTEKREVKVKGKKNKESTFVLNQDGGFELEVILYQQPLTNVITLPIQTQGLKFYYQGALTDKEKAQGVVRPEEITGSYAVYHESKKDDINYIKNKSEELKAAMELNQKMLENVAKKPVVQTWFEFK